MKKILNIGVWVVLAVGLMVCLGFAGYEQNHKACTGIEVKIAKSEENSFVTKEDIFEILANRGDSLEGKMLSTIDYNALEDLLMNNPSIKDVQVYAGLDGKVNVKVKQRAPLVRVFNNSDESYYIDVDGFLMPLSENYTSRVIVANGYIRDKFHASYARDLNKISTVDSLSKTTVLDDIYLIAKRLENDEFWGSQIQQIWVDENQELVLIPRVGNHKIIIGDRIDLDLKLNKLMIFYKEGLNKTGWNQYSIINLKYKDQVVCTKR